MLCEKFNIIINMPTPALYRWYILHFIEWSQQFILLKSDIFFYNNQLSHKTVTNFRYSLFRSDNAILPLNRAPTYEVTKS